MIALDTNILVHAHRRDAALHSMARATVTRLAESPAVWAICYHSFVEFYVVITQGRIWKRPSTPAQAFKQIQAWRESPSLRILSDDENSLDCLGRLAIDGKVHGALIHDARIAASCLSHGVRELWTVDRDFSRFPELKTANPLIN